MDKKLHGALFFDIFFGPRDRRFSTIYLNLKDPETENNNNKTIIKQTYSISMDFHTLFRFHSFRLYSTIKKSENITTQ